MINSHIYDRKINDKILFSIYTGEFPNQFAGGPNNIIYKILNSSRNSRYNFDYLSSDLFLKCINKTSLINVSENLSLKKKTAHYLFQKSTLYQKFFTSDYYLPFHILKKNKYYKSFQKSTNQYDLIHSQDSISLGLIAGKLNKSTKILTIHSKGPLSDELKNMAKGNSLSKRIDKKLKAIEVESLRVAEVITFPSKAGKNYFEESMQVRLDNEKVRIIYNGIDKNYIDTIKTDNEVLQKYLIKKVKNSLFLLNVAAHTQEKNIHIILTVINILKYKYNKEVLLINVGRGSLTKELIQLSNKLNISNNVKFLGKIPNEDVIKLVKVSDAIVMASEKVIFDIIVLEALACGSCCIVSSEGGNKEIINDGVNGYLIDIRSPERIAKIISTVNFQNVKNEAKITSNRFSVNKMVDEYFELYRTLLNEI